VVLEPPESVRKLQRALQAKAKGAPGYRFYLLYDKLHRKDVLKYAYDRCTTRAHRAWTDKTLRTSRRTGKSDGQLALTAWDDGGGGGA
jgi:hypothetical protein